MTTQVASSTSAGSLRATKTRHVVLFLLCLMYLISYLDRTTISVAAPQIIKEFGFTKSQMGLIFSAFAITYALLQVVGGTLGDRFGPRKVLALLMTWWSFFTMATAMATSFNDAVHNAPALRSGRSRRVSRRDAGALHVVSGIEPRLAAGRYARGGAPWRCARPARDRLALADPGGLAPIVSDPGRLRFRLVDRLFHLLPRLARAKAVGERGRTARRTEGSRPPGGPRAKTHGAVVQDIEQPRRLASRHRRFLLRL